MTGRRNLLLLLLHISFAYILCGQGVGGSTSNVSSTSPKLTLEHWKSSIVSAEDNDNTDADVLIRLSALADKNNEEDNNEEEENITIESVTSEKDGTTFSSTKSPEKFTFNITDPTSWMFPSSSSEVYNLNRNSFIEPFSLRTESEETKSTEKDNENNSFEEDKDSDTEKVKQTTDNDGLNTLKFFNNTIISNRMLAVDVENTSKRGISQNLLQWRLKDNSILEELANGILASLEDLGSETKLNSKGNEISESQVVETRVAPPAEFQADPCINNKDAWLCLSASERQSLRQQLLQDLETSFNEPLPSRIRYRLKKKPSIYTSKKPNIRYDIGIPDIYETEVHVTPKTKYSPARFPEGEHYLAEGTRYQQFAAKPIPLNKPPQGGHDLVYTPPKNPPGSKRRRTNGLVSRRQSPGRPHYFTTPNPDRVPVHAHLDYRRPVSFKYKRTEKENPAYTPIPATPVYTTTPYTTPKYKPTPTPHVTTPHSPITPHKNHEDLKPVKDYTEPPRKYLPPVKNYEPPHTEKSLVHDLKYEVPEQHYLPPNKDYSSPKVVEHKTPSSDYIPPKDDYKSPAVEPTEKTYTEPPRHYLPPNKSPAKPLHVPIPAFGGAIKMIPQAAPPHRRRKPGKRRRKRPKYPTTPSTHYLVPNKEYEAPKQDYEPPKSEYVAPKPPNTHYQPPINEYIPPSDAYVAPEKSYNKPAKEYATPPSQTYVPPIKESHTTKSVTKDALEYNTPPPRTYEPPVKEYLPPHKNVDHSIANAVTPASSVFFTQPARTYLPPKLEYGTPPPRHASPFPIHDAPSQEYIPPVTPPGASLPVRTYEPPLNEYLPPKSPHEMESQTTTAIPSWLLSLPSGKSTPHHKHVNTPVPQIHVTTKAYATPQPPKLNPTPPPGYHPDIATRKQHYPPTKPSLVLPYKDIESLQLGLQKHGGKHSSKLDALIPLKANVTPAPIYLAPAQTYEPPSNEYLPPIKSHHAIKPPEHSPVSRHEIVLPALPQKYEPPVNEYLPPKVTQTYEPRVKATPHPTPSRRYEPPVNAYIPPKAPHPSQNHHILTPQPHTPSPHSQHGLSQTYEPPIHEYLPPKRVQILHSPDADFHTPAPHHPSVTPHGYKQPVRTYEPPVQEYIPPSKPIVTPKSHKTTDYPAPVRRYEPPNKQYIPPQTPKPHSAAAPVTQLPPHHHTTTHHSPTHHTPTHHTPTHHTPTHHTPTHHSPTHHTPTHHTPTHHIPTHHPAPIRTYEPPYNEYLPPKHPHLPHHLGSDLPDIEVIIHTPGNLSNRPHVLVHTPRPTYHPPITPSIPVPKPSYIPPMEPSIPVPKPTYIPPKLSDPPKLPDPPKIASPKPTYVPPPPPIHIPIDPTYLPPVQTYLPPKKEYQAPATKVTHPPTSPKPDIQTILTHISSKPHTINTPKQLYEAPQNEYIPPSAEVDVTTYKPNTNDIALQLQAFAYPDEVDLNLKHRLPAISHPTHDTPTTAVPYTTSYSPPVYTPTTFGPGYNDLPASIKPQIKIPHPHSHPLYYDSDYYYYDDQYYYDDDDEYYYDDYYYDYEDDYPHPYVKGPKIKPFSKPVPHHLIPHPDYDILENEIHDWGYIAGIPGRAGRDYPILSYIPLTSFGCDLVAEYPGYYADMEAGCQVFHICHRSGRQDSFLCPNGTVFNQKYFVCDWWYNFNCEDAPFFYPVNAAIGHPGVPLHKGAFNSGFHIQDPLHRPSFHHNIHPLTPAPHHGTTAVIPRHVPPKQPVHHTAAGVPLPIHAGQGHHRSGLPLPINHRANIAHDYDDFNPHTGGISLPDPHARSDHISHLPTGAAPFAHPTARGVPLPDPHAHPTARGVPLPDPHGHPTARGVPLPDPHAQTHSNPHTNLPGPPNHSGGVPLLNAEVQSGGVPLAHSHSGSVSLQNPHVSGIPLHAVSARHEGAGISLEFG